MVGGMYGFGFWNAGILLLLGAGAVYIVIRLLSGGRRNRKEHMKGRAPELYRLAASRNGELTVSEVVTAFGLPPAEAEKELDALIDGRRVSIEVGEEGRIVYYFPELKGKEPSRRG
jgi:hypothetical protein